MNYLMPLDQPVKPVTDFSDKKVKSICNQYAEVFFAVNAVSTNAIQLKRYN